MTGDPPPTLDRVLAYDFGLAVGPAECDYAWDEVVDQVREAWIRSGRSARLAWEAARLPIRYGWEAARKGLRRIFRAEDEYWRHHYEVRPYVVRGASYDVYRPAFAYGWRERARRAGVAWQDAEPELARDWELSVLDSLLVWEDAWHAARDAWRHVEPVLARYERARGRLATR